MRQNLRVKIVLNSFPITPECLESPLGVSSVTHA